MKDQPNEAARKYDVADYKRNNHVLHIYHRSSTTHLRPLTLLRELA